MPFYFISVINKVKTPEDTAFFLYHKLLLKSSKKSSKSQICSLPYHLKDAGPAWCILEATLQSMWKLVR